MDRLILSRTVCRKLGLIGPDFPAVGAHGSCQDDGRHANVHEMTREEGVKYSSSCDMRNQSPNPPTNISITNYNFLRGIKKLHEYNVQFDKQILFRYIIEISFF